MDRLMEELERRWKTQFLALREGDDLPPGQRLRTEGLMEAVVLAGGAGAGQVTAAMDRIYREVYGRSLEEEFGADWGEFWPFPAIPAVMRRAPVWPGTAE